MIKRITITLCNGATFTCGMEEKSLRIFKAAVNGSRKDTGLMNISNLLPKEIQDGNELYIKPSEVASIRVENVSNLSLPEEKKIIETSNPVG